MKKVLLSTICILTILLSGLIGIVSGADVKGTGPDFDFTNLSGDILYLPGPGMMAVGTGVEIAKFLDFTSMRFEYAYLTSETEGNHNFVGVGVGLNIPELIEFIDGEWLLPDVLPSIGMMFLVEFADQPVIEPALYMSIMKIDF